MTWENHVDELIELNRQKADIELRLAELKGQLIEAAQAGLRAERAFEPGASFTFTGTDGSIARVSFPAPSVISGFRFDEKGAFRTKGSGSRAEHIEMPGLRRFAGEKFDKLFDPWFKPAKAFRELSARMLSPGNSEKLIELCTEPSSPRVTTQVAEVVP